MFELKLTKKLDVVSKSGIFFSHLSRLFSDVTCDLSADGRVRAVAAAAAVFAATASIASLFSAFLGAFRISFKVGAVVDLLSDVFGCGGGERRKELCEIWERGKGVGDIGESRSIASSLDERLRKLVEISSGVRIRGGGGGCGS